MAYKRTVLNECIKWNRRKAKETDDPKDKERYEENIRNLIEYKAKSQDELAHKEKTDG